jgi:hypothetical protein
VVGLVRIQRVQLKTELNIRLADTNCGLLAIAKPYPRLKARILQCRN